jgi:hypothetical protein
MAIVARTQDAWIDSQKDASESEKPGISAGFSFGQSTGLN